MSENGIKSKKFFKIFGTLVCTNLLMFALFSSEESHIPIKPPKNINLINQDNLIYQINLEFIGSLIQTPMPISILSPKGKVIVSKAYIHKKESLENDFGRTLYSVEIPPKLIGEVLQYKTGNPLQGIPYSKQSISKKRKEKSYEIYL